MKRKVIAVTGGIGSGKSTVCRLLEKKGFRVVDCDALSRRVAEQSETLEEIKRVFGKRFVADGSLDRRALAREVFSDKKKNGNAQSDFSQKNFRSARRGNSAERRRGFCGNSAAYSRQARAFRRRVGGDGKRGNARQTGDDTRRQKRGADKEHHRKAERFKGQTAQGHENHRQRRDAAMLEKTVDELLESIDA